MKRNWTVALSLSLVFVCGLAVGSLGHWLYANNTVSATTNTPARNPEEYRKRYVEEMRTRLQLNDGQLKQLNGVLDETRAKMQALKERHKPEVKQIQQEQVDKINVFLTDGQRAEYGKMRQEREEKARKQQATGGGGC
jgi:hypothetical protein